MVILYKNDKGGKGMATSSITKNFIVSGKKQAEQFANAIEESYQESLHREKTTDLQITYLHGAKEVAAFMKKRRKNGK
mgnify:CR=1 FL=1